MKYKQYTIRGISDKLDDKVREESVKYRKSLNGVLLDALAKGLGVSEKPLVFHDMDDLAGTWVEDEAFDEALAAFEAVDEALWK